MFNWVTAANLSKATWTDEVFSLSGRIGKADANEKMEMQLIYELTMGARATLSKCAAQMSAVFFQ